MGNNLIKRRRVDVRIAKNKEFFLEQLKKTPIIQIACEKAGICRATVYRWKDADLEFVKDLDIALLEGKLLVNDVAESQLMAAIRERNIGAIIFWLKHNHPSYTTKIEISANIKENYELTPEQKALVEEALRRAALPSPETNTPDYGQEPKQ